MIRERNLQWYPKVFELNGGNVSILLGVDSTRPNHSHRMRRQRESYLHVTHDELPSTSDQLHPWDHRDLRARHSLPDENLEADKYKKKRSWEEESCYRWKDHNHSGKTNGRSQAIFERTRKREKKGLTIHPRSLLTKNTSERKSKSKT